MRTAIYTRTSLDKSGQGLGVERQREDCTKLAEARGWQVTEVLVENDTSASNGPRPQFDRLLRLMESRQVDAVVVWHVDRLLRKMTDLERVIEIVERTGMRLATVSGDIDLGTDMGRMVGRIMASVSRAEVERKSARQKRANAQAAAAGKPHGSRRPFAYEADLVTVRESEAAVLRDMAGKVIAGWGYKEVAYWLNGQSITTTLGHPWYPITVRNMLSKKRYAGIREYDGTEYPAVWPAVFTPDVWSRLQLTMRLRRERRPDMPEARRYLLTGFVRCGRCGRPMNGSARRDRPDGPLRRTYICRVQGDTQRQGGCGRVRRNADALDWWITEAVIFRLDSPALGELLSSSHDDDDVRKALGSQQAQKQRLDALIDDYSTGLLTRQQFARAKASAETELQRLSDTVQELQRHRVATNLLMPGQSVRQAWESESDGWRRHLMELLIDYIEVLPGSSKPLMTLPNGQRVRFAPQLIRVHWKV